MSGRPTLYTAELAERILQELTCKRTLIEICAEPGMPCERTVRQWVQDDVDGFAARYENAREIGGPVCGAPTRYTAEDRDRIVGEITSGRTLAEVSKEPGLPSLSTIRTWIVENHEDFAVRYRQAQELGRALSGGPIPYSLELADRVLGGLMEGRTLVGVCKDPGMPSQGTVLLWVRTDRDGFAARYREAREIGSQIMVDELIEIGDNSQGDLVKRLSQDGRTELAVNYENIHRSRLRCDNRRWILSCALPRIYGDRVEVDVKHDAGSGWAELLKSVNGSTLRLPSEDETTDES